MDSYIIRIYRRDKNNPEVIVGIIEEINTGKTHPFRNLAELSAIITLSPPQNDAVVKSRPKKE
jgi:hypothetical protein